MRERSEFKTAFARLPVPKLEVVEAGVFGKNGALPGAFVLA